MSDFGARRISDELILIARILLVVLFLVYGWAKLNNYSGTVGYMTQTGAPLPLISTLVAIAVEVFVSIAIVLGILTRPLAIIFAFYTLAAALIGHRFWAMTGAEQYSAGINLYKNISIMGGFFLLYVTGPGRHSIDALISRAAGAKPPPA
jgi:putative oxidoreductase